MLSGSFSMGTAPIFYGANSDLLSSAPVAPFKTQFSDGLLAMRGKVQKHNHGLAPGVLPKPPHAREQGAGQQPIPTPISGAEADPRSCHRQEASLNASSFASPRCCLPHQWLGIHRIPSRTRGSSEVHLHPSVLAGAFAGYGRFWYSRLEHRRKRKFQTRFVLRP